MSETLPLQVDLRPVIYFTGHKSILTKGGIFTKIHDGQYAIDIKSKVDSTYLVENEEAFNICRSAFFLIIEEVTKEYGYAGFSVEGKNGRWLKPLLENKTYSHPSSIKADLDDYISFHESLVQTKFESYAESVMKIKETIETIYRYSKNIDELKTHLSNVFEKAF